MPEPIRFVDAAHVLMSDGWVVRGLCAPPSVIDDDATLDRIAKDYYSIEKAAFDSDFPVSCSRHTAGRHRHHHVERLA